MGILLKQQFVWRTRRLIPLIAVMILTANGCKQDNSSESEEGEAPTKPVPVRAASVQLLTLRPSIDLVGTIDSIPEHTALLSSQVTGCIQEVLAIEGQAVRADQVVVRLDSRPAEARLAKAQALVDEKRAVLDRLKRGFLPQEIEMARQQMQKAQTTRKALRQKMDAMTNLYKRNEVSSVKYEEMKSSLQAAEADYAEATAKLELLEAGARPEAIAEAQAQLAGAEAELAAAELDLKFCHIASSIDGVISKLLARQGMTVDPAIQLATVIDRSQLFVRFRIPSAYLAKVQPGDEADIHVPSFPDRLFHGTIARLGSQADPDTGDMDAFASVDNLDGVLRPGLVCHVHLWLPEIADALVVPTAAVADRAGTPVITVIRDNKAYEVEVSLGVQTHQYAQVTQGLSAGDLIVTEGGYGLPDGCPVLVLQEASASQPIANRQTAGNE